MTDIYDLSNKKLFTTQPNLNNYVTIASVVSAQIPLANVFNGQSYLVDIVKSMNAGVQSNPQSISFTTIQKVLDFKMYRSVKPKVIFSAYLSRVLPDNTNNIGTQTYSPVVQFKIDYDAACIGSMMALFTVNISVRSTISEINVNGISANGSSTGVKISSDDIYSIQYAYCTDFIYHYMDKVSIGFANTGGNAPIWHQEIPSEIIKIYHTMLTTPGMSATIKRAIREDQFTIGHQCYGQYGDFSFAVKTPATLPTNASYSSLGKNPMAMNIKQNIPDNYSGYNELAVYWNDTSIKEVGFGSISNKGYNPSNSYQLTFKDPVNSGSTFTEQHETSSTGSKVIKKLNLDTELYWRLGTSNSTLKIATSVGGAMTEVLFSEGKKYMKIVSDEKYLITDYADYSNLTINGELIYLIPYIKYSANDVQFNIALLHEGDIWTQADAGVNRAYTDENHQHESIFDAGNQITFALIDSQVVDGITTDYTSSIQFSMTGYLADKHYRLPTFVAISKLEVNNDQYVILDKTSGKMFARVVTTSGASEVVSDFTSQLEYTLTNSIEKALLSNISQQDSVTALSQIINKTVAEMGAYILQSTGALSPVMQQANIGYMNIDIKPYDQNDLALNALSMYTMSNGKTLQPQGTDAYAVFRYNAAIASMAANEEKHPNLINLDQQSIHTFRKDHGIVDFYVPLQFLFVCQDISQSFPHYSCAAQSILVKFEFNNPLSFMNTSISINPRAMDPTDYGHKERLLINRVLPTSVLQTQLNNMKYVLFYTRYAWVPNLMPILTQYRFYSWIIKNYERIYTPITNVSGGQTYTLATFNKSNFYTRIWTFIVTKETLDIVASRGQTQDYIPICPNRFYLNQYDVLRYGSTITSSVGSNLTGTDATTYLAQQNSVYFQTPVDSFQLRTSTSINMTDDVPCRAQLLYPYLMLEHQAIESSMDFNNLFQFNIDPVFYSEGFPYAMYSPAFAPDFKLECTTKAGSGQPDFGAIIIPEYENVSYISQHVMLLKYSTTN